MASRTAINHRFSLAAVAAQLRHAQNSLDVFTSSDAATDLRGVFSWSLTQVSPDAARLFRFLGLDPGAEIGAPAAASLAGIPFQRTQALLAELCDANLLIENAPGRFAFHDLLRTYAFELVTTHEAAATRHATIKRVLDHYLYTGYAAATLVQPHGVTLELAEPALGVTPEPMGEVRQAQEWLAIERPTLIAAVSAAHEAGLYLQTWQLARAVHDYLDNHGHWQDNLTVLPIALDAVGRLGRPDLQVMVHRMLARSYIRLERQDDAFAHLDAGLAVAERLNLRLEQANAHQGLAMLCSKQRRHTEAIAHSRHAVQLLRSLDGNVGDLALALNTLGWDLAQAGDLQDALGPCEEAIALLEDGDEHYLGLTLDSLGYVHHQLSDHDTAIAYFNRALTAFRSVGNRYFEADTLIHLGDTISATGDHPAARERWREALAILDELGHSEAERARAKLAG